MLNLKTLGIPPVPPLGIEGLEVSSAADHIDHGLLVQTLGVPQQRGAHTLTLQLGPHRQGACHHSALSSYHLCYISGVTYIRNGGVVWAGADVDDAGDGGVHHGEVQLLRPQVRHGGQPVQPLEGEAAVPDLQLVRSVDKAEDGVQTVALLVSSYP